MVELTHESGESAALLFRDFSVLSDVNLRQTTRPHSRRDFNMIALSSENLLCNSSDFVFTLF
jgi:hypothetical protein